MHYRTNIETAKENETKLLGTTKTTENDKSTPSSLQSDEKNQEESIKPNLW